MKRIVLVIVIVLLAASPKGYGKEHNKSVDTGNACPVFFLGLSAGINNLPGVIGINAALPINQKVSLGAGVGLSYWGPKAYGEVTYFFNPCHKGWAVGAGATRSSGMRDVRRTLHTVTGKEDVTLNLYPKTNVFFAGYKYWSVGQRGNKIFLMFGWSVGVTDTKYKVISGQVLTQDQKDRINAISPGGVILGGGFLFGFHGKK